jgi:glutamine synthetase
MTEYQVNASAQITVKLEYVWLDGYKSKNTRSKVRYVEWTMDSESGNMSRESVLDRIPDWNFDGSSTKQAVTENSDIILVPVKVYHNPMEQSEMPSFIVLCETYNTDGSPHESNHRHQLENVLDSDIWFAVEQEYTLMDVETDKPVGFSKKENVQEQGEYYCGNGGANVTNRFIVEQHAFACIQSGISIYGTNAEVLLSQWEYQLNPNNAIDMADDLWVSRFLLQRICEDYGVYASFHPKPISGDWNGAGAHINFSTEYMRENSDKEYIENVCEVLRETHDEHIAVYGEDNELRLTGDCETQHISKFSYGVNDRGASIRIPSITAENWKGYLEDRRPSANMDPYEAFIIITENVSKICEQIEA